MHPYVQGIQDKINKNEIVRQLLSLLAEEFVSSFNYRMQAKMVQGFNKEEIRKELLEHSREEDLHADLIMERIIELGGNPEIRPLDWDKFSDCKYIPTTSNDQLTILEDAVRGKRCAIEHYTKAAQFAQTKDPTTYNLVHRILNDEYGHLKNLNKLLKEVKDVLPGIEPSDAEDEEHPETTQDEQPAQSI